MLWAFDSVYKSSTTLSSKKQVFPNVLNPCVCTKFNMLLVRKLCTTHISLEGFYFCVVEAWNNRILVMQVSAKNRKLNLAPLLPPSKDIRLVLYNLKDPDMLHPLDPMSIGFGLQKTRIKLSILIAGVSKF